MAIKKNDNSRNQDSLLFKQLTRLFSGPIVNYRRQTQRKFRKKQLDSYADKFTSTSGQQFKKTEYGAGFEALATNQMLQQDRTIRYMDFEQMEYMPEIASGLDIYADEITTSTKLTPLLSIDCQNQEIKDILNALYHNILNIEHNLFGWARTMCKYGDFFLYLDIDDVHGITNGIGLPPSEIERLEGQDPTNPNYVQYQWNSARMTFENWQIAHFRVLGNDRYAPYGTSVLEPARRIWRQLTLLEDAMMAYRIVRSPERRVFYIDIGNIATPDVEQYMERIKTTMKRNQIVDSRTGRVDLRYNPMSIDEDYFIPVRAGNNTKIETLPGGTYTGDIDDVKYLRDKLFSALKIPASYLSRAEGADEDKATLAQKDIRFARTIQRLQRVIVSELEKIGIVHLYTLGYRKQDLVGFKLSLNNPSKIAELQELEHWNTKFDVASAATEGYFSRRWVAKNIFQMSDEQIQQNQREMFFDKFLDSQFEAAASGGGEGGGPGGGGGGGLGDLSLDSEGEGAGAEEEAGGEEDSGGDEDSMLLAAPARRSSSVKQTTTPASKGKMYTPKNFNGKPQLGGDRRSAGAAKRSTDGSWSKESASNTRRNTHKGMSDIMGLVKSSFLESNQRTNYDAEEAQILTQNNEIKRLIEQLGRNQDGYEEEK
jgi:hypothetical protein